MQGHGMSAMQKPSSNSPSTMAYAVAMDAMMKNMVVEFTGDADVDFMQGKIPHHQGAIDMAKVVLQFGKDPGVRKLAEEVIKAQKGGIIMMERWLADHS